MEIGRRLPVTHPRHVHRLMLPQHLRRCRSTLTSLNMLDQTTLEMRQLTFIETRDLRQTTHTNAVLRDETVAKKDEHEESVTIREIDKRQTYVCNNTD